LDGYIGLHKHNLCVKKINKKSDIVALRRENYIYKRHITILHKQCQQFYSFRFIYRGIYWSNYTGFALQIWICTYIPFFTTLFLLG